MEAVTEELAIERSLFSHQLSYRMVISVSNDANTQVVVRESLKVG